jgi:hypothetical protein
MQFTPASVLHLPRVSPAMRTFLIRARSENIDTPERSFPSPSPFHRQRSDARDPSGLVQRRLTLPRRSVSLHSILNAMGLSAVE